MVVRAREQRRHPGLHRMPAALQAKVAVTSRGITASPQQALQKRAHLDIIGLVGAPQHVQQLALVEQRLWAGGGPPAQALPPMCWQARRGGVLGTQLPSLCCNCLLVFVSASKRGSPGHWVTKTWWWKEHGSSGSGGSSPGQPQQRQRGSNNHLTSSVLADRRLELRPGRPPLWGVLAAARRFLLG